MKVTQLFNLVENQKNFGNPQRGRVYDIRGIAPTIYCFEVGNLKDDTEKVFKNPTRGRVYGSHGVAATLTSTMYKEAPYILIWQKKRNIG